MRVQFYTFDISLRVPNAHPTTVSVKNKMDNSSAFSTICFFFKCEVETTYVRRAGSNGRNRTNKNNNIDIEAFILHTFWDLKKTV